MDHFQIRRLLTLMAITTLTGTVIGIGSGIPLLIIAMIVAALFVAVGIWAIGMLPEISDGQIQDLDHVVLILLVVIGTMGGVISHIVFGVPRDLLFGAGFGAIIGFLVWCGYHRVFSRTIL